MTAIENEASPQGIIAAVREEVAALAAPVKVRAAELDARIQQLEAELYELRSARNEVMALLRRIDPAAAPGKGNHNKGSRVEQDAAKRKAVVRYLEKHSAELGETFTAAQLYQAMRNDNVKPRPGQAKVYELIAVLHSEGVLRLDRTTTNGGKVYAVVGGSG